MLTTEQIERLEDIIGESGHCNDDECGCHRLARTALDILNGDENYEVIDGK
jgi:hypothetical protein